MSLLALGDSLLYTIIFVSRYQPFNLSSCAFSLDLGNKFWKTFLGTLKNSIWKNALLYVI